MIDIITNKQAAWVAIAAAVIILPAALAQKREGTGTCGRSYMLLWFLWLVAEAAWRLAASAYPPVGGASADIYRTLSRVTTVSAALIIISGVWPDALAGTRRIARRIAQLWTIYLRRD